MRSRRFVDALVQTIDRRLKLSDDSRGLVAVSGGADSVALLLGLVELARSRHWELVVAHLEHGIRGDESVSDAGFVTALAEQLHLKHVSRSVDVPSLAESRKLSLESAARQARYDFLAETARQEHCTWVATGHTADDNAETVMMNLLRGAGPVGISGIPIDRPITANASIRLVRPLLRQRRALVEEYLRQHNQSWRTDHSNLDRKHLRNRVRHDLLPLLTSHVEDGDIVEHLNRLAELGGRLSEILWKESEGLSRLLRADEGPLPGLNCERLTGLPELLAGQVVRNVLGGLVGNLREFERQHVEHVLELARNGSPGREIVLVRSIHVYRDYDRLLFALGPVPLPAFESVELGVPGQVCLTEPGVQLTAELEARNGRTLTELLLRKDRWTEWLDADATGRTLRVRPRRPGDRLKPLGAPGVRKLQDFLTDRRLSRFRRDGWPLVTVDDRIAWVVGMGLADPFKVTERTCKLLKLEAHWVEHEPRTSVLNPSQKLEETA